jgi:hypothetical protein
MSKQADEQRARLREILAEHGIELEIGSCGCCMSPWVFVSYKGEPIVYEGGFTQDGETPIYRSRDEFNFETPGVASVKTP